MADIAKVLTTYQTFLYFCINLNIFIKKKLKYFTRPKQISPDLSGVSGDFRIVCMAFILHMLVPCDKTFLFVPKILTL